MILITFRDSERREKLKEQLKASKTAGEQETIAVVNEFIETVSEIAPENIDAANEMKLTDFENKISEVI